MYRSGKACIREKQTNWQEVCEHPGLQNLPFKLEVNERGQIIMNAVRVISTSNIEDEL